jgi:4-hydroxybenzoate polyprenyltransferase
VAAARDAARRGARSRGGVAVSAPLKPYLQLMRAPALFTALSNAIAAHLVATGGAIAWATLVPLALASCALLASGMVLNDCFDLRIDARERPQRPLPSGAIAVATAWRLGFALLAAGVALAASAGLRPLLVAAALAAAILLYDGVLKSTVLGPVLMGLCRYLNWVLGLSILALDATAWLLPLPVLVYVTALTVLSRAEARAQDRRLVVAAGGGLALAAAAVAALFGAGVLTQVAVLPLTGAALAYWLALIVRCCRVHSPAAIQGAVGRLIMGLVPLDVLLVIGRDLYWGLGLLLLMLPGRWLGRRLYVT